MGRAWTNVEGDPTGKIEELHDTLGALLMLADNRP
jgi:hypothetical protein